MVNARAPAEPGAERQPGHSPTVPSLLATKLYIPRVRAGLVPRPHLTRRLDEGLQGRLTLVSAPAGFGKSTLVGEWARLKNQATPPLTVAWLSLDAADSDPTRFWAYFIAALQQVEPAAGRDLLALLHTPQPPPIEVLLTRLLNEISAIPFEFAFVLDDYHAIDAQAIHDALAFMLEHLPPQMHLVIASRTDPPLPLPRLRSRGQLVELRAADLRFTPDEATAFLNRVMGLALTPEDIAVLDARTEGWVAGLQLAALSMQGVDDRAGFVRAFGGSHRYLLDYLAEEILDRQPKGMRTFLLRTAILERLSGPLCDAVTEAGDGQATLERLEQANLFLVPLDQERHWYRYHHLFAEFLRSRLEQAQPGAALSLHRRASAWYAAHGQLAEAVGHALAAQAFDEAADLIEAVAEEMFARSELATLNAWLEALPLDVRGRPKLAIIRAWVLVATGLHQQVAPLLEELRRNLQELGDEARGALGEVAVVESVLALNQLRLQETIALCREAQDCLASRERGLFNTALALNGAAAFNLGLAYEFSGDVQAASDALAEAATLSRQAGNLHIAPMALSRLANLQVVAGRLRQAAETFGHALRLARDMAERPSPMSGQAYTGFGDLLREQNDLDSAEAYLQQGLELGRQWRSLESLAGGYIGLARVRQARGDTRGALQALDELATTLEGPQVPWMVPLLQAARARVWAMEGRLDDAAGWLETCGLSAADAPAYSREVEHITLARVLIALGRHREALDLLARLLAATEAGGRMGRAIEVLALQALALQAEGEARRAVATLERALRLAGPEGYVRIFLDEGEPMVRILEHVSDLDAGELKGYAERLLAVAAGAAFHPMSSTRPRRSAAALVEPLSEREVEVLRKIAAGLSNQEIAQALVVSLNTVKTHLKNIYAKLGVRSRTQALARARELGLL